MFVVAPDAYAHFSHLTLLQLVRVLESAPQLQYVWFDFWCLPQKRFYSTDDSGDDRTDEQKAYFVRVLQHTLLHLNLRVRFVPLWNCGVPADGHRFLDRAWCYSEYLWGRDRLLLIEGVNNPGPEQARELDLEFTGFIARAV